MSPNRPWILATPAAGMPAPTPRARPLRQVLAVLTAALAAGALPAGPVAAAPAAPQVVQAPAVAGAMRIDANRASPAELDALKGVGPSMLNKILTARQAKPFADWADFVTRVPGVGPGKAASLSNAGLTIGGAAWNQALAPVKGRGVGGFVAVAPPAPVAPAAGRAPAR